jgi:energy-converting hydrogenase Eha subunit G
MAAVIPGIMEIHCVGGAVVAISQHAVARNLYQHRPARINFLHILVECEAEGISIVTINILGVILNNRRAPRFIKISYSVASVNLTGFTSGIIIQGSAISVIVKDCGSIYISESRLAGAHEVAGAIPISMLSPAVGDVGVR